MSPRRACRRSGGASEAARWRHAWLELVQQSGPFLTLPVVERVFPNGMPEVPLAARARVRGAVAEMMAADGAGRQGVVEQVLYAALDWAQRARLGHDLPAALAEDVPGHPVTVRPDFGFAVDETSTPGAEAVDVADVPDAVNVTGDDVEAPEDDELPGERGAAADGLWRMLGLISAWGVHPLQRTTEAGWAASGVERLALLLRARSVPVGLVTDGRWWALVWAPLGGTTGAAVWDASLWGEEPETFRAFVALLTRRRFLGAAATDTLPLMLHESLAAQEEVTVTLGRQVRDAVELLLATLDRLDAESAGRLLGGVSDDALYDGVVTVMMRLVFLLFAEERRLLPSDDAVYTAGYGVARLVEQLEQAAAVAGEQSLEHRTGAWHRLLAVSRALHRGVAHEDLRLPAYGGGLFDPDRYPWLEGRRAGGTGADAAARPPAVDDRTVLRMLRAVQYVKIAGERRKLTFRALDVEQIGYVYEGLLELEVRTATDVVLGVQRPAAWPKGKVAAAAEVPLSQVTAWAAEAPPRLAQRLKERTGRSESWVEQHLLRSWRPTSGGRCCAPPAATFSSLSSWCPSRACSAGTRASLPSPSQGGGTSRPAAVGRAPAPITRRAHSPRTSSSTPSSRWRTGPARWRPPTGTPGGSAPPARSSTCESPTSPWARAPSSSRPAATSPIGWWKPGWPKVALTRSATAAANRPRTPKSPRSS